MPGAPIRSLITFGKQTRFGQPGQKLCGAKAKRTGFSCRQPAMKNGRCRLHGGKTPKHKDRGIPKTKRALSVWLNQKTKKEAAWQSYVIKKDPPPINWRYEEQLIKLGLLQRLNNDMDRYELRNAFALYASGKTPWITWHQTLEHFGLC